MKIYIILESYCGDPWYIHCAFKYKKDADAFMSEGSEFSNPEPEYMYMIQEVEVSSFY